MLQVIGKKRITFDTSEYILPDFIIPTQKPDFSFYNVELGPVVLIKTMRKKETVLEDYDARLQLCRLIGLKELPKPNPNAIDELSGLLANKIKLKKLDAVELVREVRGY